MPEVEAATVLNLGVAGLIGLLVGLEREWSGHATGPNARFAGVRTFLLIGLLGGIAGLCLRDGLVAIAAVLLAAGALLILLGYAAATMRGKADTDGTTEVAALVVLALALLAGQGFLALAGGVAAVVALALREKAVLHRLVHKIGETELKAGIQFAVLALVVLPLLPEGPYGPLGGLRPRSLWAVVLLFSALNFLGYIARRIAGPGIGYPVTGMLGGILSSTAVTLQFSRQSRRESKMAAPLALGVLGACTVLLPRVAIVSALLNPAVAFALLRYLALPALIGVGILVWGFLQRQRHAADDSAFKDRNPLRLVSAVQLAVAFQVVLMALSFVQERFGSTGITASAAVLGLTDVDALTFSMSRLGRSDDLVRLAAQSIAVGILANTALKLGLSLVLGSAAFRWRAAMGLLLLGGAILFGLLLLS